MKLNVAVVFGGRSVEHEISILSALQCIDAINLSKYNIIPIYISKQGIWYTGNGLFELENYRDLDRLLAKSHRVYVDQNSGSAKLYSESKIVFVKDKIINVDLVLPVVHGTNGEDGVLQGVFETMSIPYVGCDVLSSAITMDKVITKMLLQNIGVKVLEHIWFYGEKWRSAKDELMTKIKTKFTYPLIVKPGNLGSSIGVTLVSNDTELEDAIDLAVRMSRRVLVEPKVVNLKEVNCAVLGDSDFVEVSVCEEPTRTEEILSYQDKYAGGSKGKLGVKVGKTAGGMSNAKRKIPAEIPEALANKIQEIARRAFVNLGCSGVVRIDFLIDQTTNEIYVCELNTIPGSLSFYLWEPTGKSFTDLLERLFLLAIKRHRENNNLITSYDRNILNG